MHTNELLAGHAFQFENIKSVIKTNFNNSFDKSRCSKSTTTLKTDYSQVWLNHFFLSPISIESITIPSFASREIARQEKLKRKKKTTRTRTEMPYCI